MDGHYSVMDERWLPSERNLFLSYEFTCASFCKKQVASEFKIEKL
jgi:hypothetical protein